jgi:hypothetical protein
MAFNLKLLFTGMCAFAEHSTDGMFVLLVDGRTQVTDLMHTTPILRFNREELTSALGPDLFLENKSPDHVKSCMQFLPPGDFKINAGVTTTGVTFATAINPPTLEPTDDNRDDWRWVPALEEILPGAGTSRESWFGDSPPAVVASRFLLPAGVFSTHDFLRQEGDVDGAPSKVDLFNFATGAAGKAVASFAACDLTCDGPQVEILHKSPGSSIWIPFAVFDPNGKDLNLQIWNTPFRDVMHSLFPEVNSVPQHHWGNNGKFEGQSFQHFYRLNSMSGSLPHPNNVGKSTGVLAARELQKTQGCSPGTTTKFTPTQS